MKVQQELEANGQVYELYEVLYNTYSKHRPWKDNTLHFRSPSRLGYGENEK